MLPALIQQISLKAGVKQREPLPAPLLDDESDNGNRQPVEGWDVAGPEVGAARQGGSPPIGDGVGDGDIPQEPVRFALSR